MLARKITLMRLGTAIPSRPLYAEPSNATTEEKRMLENLSEKISIPINCPGCGEKLQKTLAELDRDREFTCSNCNTVIRLEGDDIAKAKEAFESFGDSFNRMPVPRRSTRCTGPALPDTSERFPF